MDAKLGLKPSFAWRSIYGARELIEASLFWRVRNGQQVKIWVENWIPLPITYKVQFPPREMDITSKVNQLTDWDRKWWDNDKLINVFSAEEIAAIETIPICHTD